MKKLELLKTRIRMDATRAQLPDGRYVIYYTFEPETEPVARFEKRVPKPLIPAGRRGGK